MLPPRISGRSELILKSVKALIEDNPFKLSYNFGKGFIANNTELFQSASRFSLNENKTKQV